MATAQILFHRFWYVSSMKQFSIGVRIYRLIYARLFPYTSWR